MRKAVKIFSLVLSALLLMLLCACGSEEKAAALGTYRCVEKTAFGCEIEPEGETLSLYRFRMGSLLMDGVEYNIRWRLADGKLRLTQDNAIYEGTLTDNVAEVRIGTVLFTFLREGVTEEKSQVIVSPLDGQWQGTWTISSPSGKWRDLDGMEYSCTAEITSLENGERSVKIWDDEGSKDIPLADVTVSVSKSGNSAVSIRGYFGDEKLLKSDWMMEYSPEGYENMVVIRDCTYASGEDGFKYEIILAPAD